MGRLNRFRIRINLNRIRIVNRFTQPTSGCGLNPVETGLVLKEVRVNSWWGHYKTWTLDSGLDHGLDSGLNNGLNNWTKISIAKGKCRLHINQQQSFCL